MNYCYLNDFLYLYLNAIKLIIKSFYRIKYNKIFFLKLILDEYFRQFRMCSNLFSYPVVFNSWLKILSKKYLIVIMIFELNIWFQFICFMKNIFKTLIILCFIPILLVLIVYVLFLTLIIIIGII
ncbi:hypothetical protein rpr22_CDS028 [Rickettsia prowazekii str. Rp22]|uniref:Uncharacterized protein n=1 Tax=Rickettsia prowazekii (strain Rp22) TaxID=449216 RepID=D5AVV2_RICPP|nr:hypothetical protein rpr22_CDS028 [Rickettsia prowazekii str. Rp22]